MPARSASIPTALKVLFFTLLAACTVAALQTVGAFLVIAMVVTPGATAYLLTDRFPRLIVISVAIGALTSFVGAYLSYFLDGATGGIIVVLQTLVFLTAFVFAPKHGLLAARRRVRDALGGRAHERPVRHACCCPSSSPSCSSPRHRRAGRGADGAAVVLPGAQGLVADGRRDLAMRCCPASSWPISPACRWQSAPSRAGMICALATGYLKENSRIKEDTVMGVVFSGMFGLGIVLYTKIETEVHLDHILFGDMLGVGWPRPVAERRSSPRVVAGHHRLEVARSAAARLRSAAGPGHRPAGAAAALRPAGVLLADDRRRAEGSRHHPGHRHADRARRHRLSADAALRTDADRSAVLIAVLASFFGVYLSFFIDSAPAPTIVLLMSLTFVAAYLVSRRRAKLAERRLAGEMPAR